MKLAQVTAPTGYPVSVAEVKGHLRVDADDEDAYLDDLITAARLHIEGPNGIAGLALETQTWDGFLDRFPCWDDSDEYGWGYRLSIDLPPLQSVTSIKYLDSAGVEQTLASNLYTVDARPRPPQQGYVIPAFGQVWPPTYLVPNAVTVRFVAGYGTAEAIPRPLRLALMHLVAHWFENREPVAIGTGGVMPIPNHLQALLAQYRVGMLV